MYHVPQNPENLKAEIAQMCQTTEGQSELVEMFFMVFNRMEAVRESMEATEAKLKSAKRGIKTAEKKYNKATAALEQARKMYGHENYVEGYAAGYQAGYAQTHDEEDPWDAGYRTGFDAAFTSLRIWENN
jgi:multidrug resistance efflux pump